jgi:SAM-dependent methyltransferase
LPGVFDFIDKYVSSGTAKGAYFYQDILVAQRIYANNPNVHVDIGSRIDGFVAHVASFRKINVMDIRPLKNTVKNIVFIQQDFMKPITNNMVEFCDSVSCLHAVEYFGLGRYGDHLRYDGHIIGLENLYRILKKHGKLYFSAPVGIPQRIEFNAHRIFSVEYLLKQFKEKFKVEIFSYVDDEGELHENVPLSKSSIIDNFGYRGNGVNGCGIFEMTKL